MNKNVNKIDSYLRITLAIVAVILYLTEVVPGTSGLILIVIGAIFLLTGGAKFCPIYFIFGINKGK
jgi:hypothetical protein